MRFLSSFIVVIGLLFLSSSVYAVNQDGCGDSLDKCMQVFYQHPTAKKLIQLSEWPNIPEDQKTLQVFLTMALYKNPSLTQDIIKQFPNLFQKSKKLFINALLAIHNPEAKKVATEYHLHPKLTMTPANMDTLKINGDAVNLDLLWSAYFATGDVIYPEKIAQFINQNDDYSLKTALRIKATMKACAEQAAPADSCSDSELQKIIAEFKAKYPTQAQEKFHHVVVLSSAIWSLSDLRQQDEQLNQKILVLFKQKPELDYTKKIPK